MACRRMPIGLFPLRDLLSLSLFVAGFFGRDVSWKGHRYRMCRGRQPGFRTEIARTMMKTLFLQAPSFDGFDGGAGARYQMRREIKSFWYPTWLAQPAALVEGSKLIDAPPHRLKFDDVAPDARSHDLVVLHTSTPSFASDVQDRRALKATNPGLKIGMIGAKVAVEPDGALAGVAQRSISSPATSSISPSRKSPRAATSPASPGCPSATPTAPSCTTTTAPSSRTWTQLPFVTPVYKRDLDDRELFHRLSEAPLYLVLHRPRLQIALHVLPVAADRRRPPLPHPQRRPRDRGAGVGARRHSRR